MALLHQIKDVSIGIAGIDDEHRQLLDIVNELYRCLLSGTADVILDELLKGMIAAGEEHLHHEEALFAEYAYPHARQHIHQHNLLRNKLLGLRYAAEHGAARQVALDAMILARRWASEHVSHADRDYARFLIGKGVH